MHSHPINRRQFLLLASMLTAGAVAGFPASRSSQRFIVGCYTNANNEKVPSDFGLHRTASDISDGLYTFTLQTDSGVLNPAYRVAKTSNPVNLICHPKLPVIYACRGQGSRESGQNLITAFRWVDNHLVELNTVRSGGLGPTVGAVEQHGKYLLTTNFATNSLVAFKLNKDGSLINNYQLLGDAFYSEELELKGPGEISHSGLVFSDDLIGKPHDIKFSASHRYAIATEISANRCRVVKVEPDTGALVTHQLVLDASGAGPRHLAWHPGYKFLYTSGEANSSISVWAWNESKGELRLLQNLNSVPERYSGKNHPADVVMHPSGEFVFVTNRGAGVIASYRIDQLTGKVKIHEFVELSSPSSWSMCFDRTGSWALITEQIGDRVSGWEMERHTGRLKSTQQQVRIILPSCVRHVNF